jgi:hypothetical protein
MLEKFKKNQLKFDIPYRKVITFNPLSWWDKCVNEKNS